MTRKASTTASFDDGIELDSIDDVVLESLPVPDRLPPMLFLAALVHGILIIGVTFNAVLNDEFRDAISLEVTIVADPDPNVLEPERAEYLAQASQDGAGNTQEQARPTCYAIWLKESSIRKGTLFYSTTALSCRLTHSIWER